MKKTAIAAIAFSVIAFTSCSKSDDSSSTTTIESQSTTPFPIDMNQFAGFVNQDTTTVNAALSSYHTISQYTNGEKTAEAVYVTGTYSQGTNTHQLVLDYSGGKVTEFIFVNTSTSPDTTQEYAGAKAYSQQFLSLYGEGTYAYYTDASTSSEVKPTTLASLWSSLDAIGYANKEVIMDFNTSSTPIVEIATDITGELGIPANSFYVLGAIPQSTTSSNTKISPNLQKALFEFRGK